MDTLLEQASAPAVVLLLATQPERTQLLHRALASVQSQVTLPDAAVIVCDGGTLIPSSLPCLSAPPIQMHCLSNPKVSGAARTWNTGIHHIATHWPDCYVAILDDDDEWDMDHLATCLVTARQNQWPDVVLSGLRMIRDDVEQTREPIVHAKVQDFLVGNPGWQGSNTFIRFTTLLRAGGFTPGLQSCNDRDLAIRVLSLDGVRIAFTGRHTASWHLDSHRSALSTQGSQHKLDGLAHFYHLHGHRMSTDIRQQFFDRASSLLGWQQEQILQRAQEWLHA